MNFGLEPCKAREVWAGAVAKKSLRHVLSLQLAKASAATLLKNKASAATLSQQEENDSADVKRGGVNIYQAFSVQR